MKNEELNDYDDLIIKKEKRKSSRENNKKQHTTGKIKVHKAKPKSVKKIIYDPESEYDDYL